MELAEIGGKGVLEVLKDLDGHRVRKVMQDMTKVTSAKMIKNEFGLIKFNDLPASEVQYRFNALFGSNTRPRAVIASGFKPNFIN